MLGTSSLRSLKLNIKEAYNVMQGECGIDVGDTVRIMRKAECHELGWNTSWPSTMDSYVGKEFTVTENPPKGSGEMKDILKNKIEQVDADIVTLLANKAELQKAVKSLELPEMKHGDIVANNTGHNFVWLKGEDDKWYMLDKLRIFNRKSEAEYNNYFERDRKQIVGNIFNSWK